MKILTVEVRDGQVQVPAGALGGVSEATLIVAEPDDAGFHLSAEEAEMLRRSIAEADRGETVDAWEVLEGLKQ
jgi:hypothetical protein